MPLDSIPRSVLGEVNTGSASAIGCFEPCGSRPDIPWRCVYTKPNGETVAEMHLRMQGYSAWLPKHSIEWQNRQKRLVPLFARYLFVQIAADVPWSPVANTRGVAGVLKRPDGQIAEVPLTMLRRIWSQCAANGVIYPDEAPTLTVGGSARPLDGPFADMVAVCSMASRDRVWLLMSIMGRDVPVEFARDAVVPV